MKYLCTVPPALFGAWRQPCLFSLRDVARDRGLAACRIAIPG